MICTPSAWRRWPAPQSESSRAPLSALGIHAIGNALAIAEGLKSKHAVKQVDRMLSNEGIPVWSLMASWVPYVVGDRLEIVVALDWTTGPTSTGTTNRPSDKVDARTLAQLLRAGLIPEVRMPDCRTWELRQLISLDAFS